jgi:ABC-2 type transport system ATP-binding protein
MVELNALADRFSAELDRPIRHLSKGNRQKIGLVQAFMHRPELVILDEPTSGLDPLMQEEFLDLVREVVAEGRTVFLSSHSLDEVQHVADRVGIIREGTLAAVESVETLRERAIRQVRIVFCGPAPVDEFASLPGVREVVAEGARLRLAVAGGIDAVVKAAARHDVVDLLSEPADLDEIFLTFYRGGEP